MECDLCYNKTICYSLPCYLNYGPGCEISEDLEENIMDHEHLKKMCVKCIIKVENRCPVCLSKFVIRYKNTKCRCFFNYIITILYLVTTVIALGLSFIGIIGGFHTPMPIYAIIGYVIDMVLAIFYVLITIYLDYHINTTIFTLFVLSVFHVGYSALIFLDIGIFFIQYIHMTICCLLIYSNYKKCFCLNTICDSPNNIKEIIGY